VNPRKSTDVPGSPNRTTRVLVRFMVSCSRCSSIVSTQPTQSKYDPKNKAAIWGSYGYDPKFDVVRAPMQIVKLQHSVDQFTIAFFDVTDKGGNLAMAWGTEAAIVPFTVAP